MCTAGILTGAEAAVGIRDTAQAIRRTAGRPTIARPAEGRHTVRRQGAVHRMVGARHTGLARPEAIGRRTPRAGAGRAPPPRAPAPRHTGLARPEAIGRRTAPDVRRFSPCRTNRRVPELPAIVPAGRPFSQFPISPARVPRRARRGRARNRRAVIPRRRRRSPARGLTPLTPADARPARAATKAWATPSPRLHPAPLLAVATEAVAIVAGTAVVVAVAAASHAAAKTNNSR